MLDTTEATILSPVESTLSRVTYADRFKKGLARPGKTRKGVADAMGISPQAVGQIVNGQTKAATAENNAAAAAYFGCDPTWLAAGKGTPNWSDQGQAKEIDLDHNGDYPSVRRVRFKLSAGVSGYAIESADEDGPPIVFRRDWFELNGYQPEKLLAARVNGASMEPTLYEGDLVVINTAQVSPKDGHAFALNYEGVLTIKRLVRDAGEWWLRSDNLDKRHFADKRTHPGVTVIGEVVYRQSERI